ncbi:syndetin-like [Macrosteles quadrilineatus]|uniref:syndetin-like n=1 Tax=Macrosteles quadrilineatus TaxID=74068 RepID=UPI0023E27F66|nr:syndetin-like [Macrosteles quadrilineatus]
MDDIKHKIFEFISKQSNPGKVPIVARSFETNHSKPDATEDKPTVTLEDNKNAPSDSEILETIQPEYFQENEFDSSLFELKKLPDELFSEVLEKDLAQLKKQQVVVSNQVLQLILEKQSACEQEFNRIVEVQSLVGETLEVVQRGRQDLEIARKHFTTASLGILANYRKRTIIQDLLRSLNSIKTIQLTESRMQEMLAAGDFAGAISLLVECQSATALYRHFSCVAALSGKLQDTLVMAEEQLDQALSGVCYNFDESIYSKLQAAYALLGKTQIAMDQLHMHFTSAVHNSAYKVVHAHTQQDSSKKQYAALCKSVPEDKFIVCLVELCKALWGIVLSYHQVVNWHQQHNTQTHVGEGDNFESSLYEQYVHQKLEAGLKRLWHDTQTRVSPLFLAAQLTHYKFDEFLQLLAIVHRLEQIGEEFCGSESEELQNCVQAQSSNYFRQYHTTRLDELRIFLENETWTPCPVRDDFSLLHLQEFRGVRGTLQQLAGGGGAVSRGSGSLDGSSVGGSFFTRYAKPGSGTPFDSCPDVGDLSQDENILDVTDPSGYFSEESDDDHAEMNGDSSSSRNRRRQESSGPLLTNTTLTVLRHCGKYLHMSKLLRSNSNDVVICLSQLFDYYLYAIFSFFASDLPSMAPSGILSLKLQSTLKRIRESLTHNERETNACEFRVGEPSMSMVVDLSSTETLHGLSERVVAVESLVFLAKQYTSLKPYLEHLQPQSHTLHVLYNQSVSIAEEVRRPVYACVAWRAVDVKQTLSLMARVNWEVKDVMSQHSGYVDLILRDLQIFSMRLEEISKHIKIPAAVTDSLWGNIAYQLADVFVEGFASAKKCSNGGRGLMQLDWTQLVSQVEKMCSLRPIPHRELVDAYVKAYYLPESALETFVREHNEYSSKQMLALISCACQTNKKLRQKLTALIEDQERVNTR